MIINNKLQEPIPEKPHRAKVIEELTNEKVARNVAKSLDVGHITQTIANDNVAIANKEAFGKPILNNPFELKKESKIKNYIIDDQGYTNACGTTSLHSVLRYHGDNVKDHWEIDKSIRSTRFDMFTAPGDIINYSKDRGFNAGMKNNASLEDIAYYVDRGIPAITLIDPDNEYNFNMHYIVITGYERGDNGKINKVQISDPAIGGTYDQDAVSFIKEWSNLKVGFEGKRDIKVDIGDISVGTSYNRMMIAVVPKNKNILTPEGKSINTSSIPVPKKHNTVRGFVFGDIVARGAIVVDKTLSIVDSARKYLGI